MKAALIVTAVWMLSCAVLQGAERGFDDIVRAISDQFHNGCGLAPWSSGSGILVLG